MNPTDPQFLYMVLILPNLFGFTLIGEGFHKVLNERPIGWVSILAGVGFIGVVAGAYLVLTGLL